MVSLLKKSRFCTVAVGARVFVMLGWSNSGSESDNVYTFDTRQNVWENYGIKLPYVKSDLAYEYLQLKDGRKVILMVGLHPGANFYLDMADEAGGWVWDAPDSGLTDPSIWWGAMRDIANLGRSVAWLIGWSRAERAP
jgi:hypothetical protein